MGPLTKAHIRELWLYKMKKEDKAMTATFIIDLCHMTGVTSTMSDIILCQANPGPPERGAAHLCCSAPLTHTILTRSSTVKVTPLASDSSPSFNCTVSLGWGKMWKNMRRVHPCINRCTQLRREKTRGGESPNNPSVWVFPVSRGLWSVCGVSAGSHVCLPGVVAYLCNYL